MISFLSYIPAFLCSPYILGQFTNSLAVEAHYLHTAPEIFSDCAGKMDALVAGVGSGSSISGVGRYLKEEIPGFRVIAVEPADSPVLSGGQDGESITCHVLHIGSLTVCRALARVSCPKFWTGPCWTR